MAASSVTEYRRLDRANGRRAAKSISKGKQRRRDRDNNHDLARRYNGGERDVEELDE